MAKSDVTTQNRILDSSAVVRSIAEQPKLIRPEKHGQFSSFSLTCGKTLVNRTWKPLKIFTEKEGEGVQFRNMLLGCQNCARNERQLKENTRTIQNRNARSSETLPIQLMNFFKEHFQKTLKIQNYLFYKSKVGQY